MKRNKTTTITREYNEKGDLLKETEVIVEEEILDNYAPFYPTTVPYTYPQITYLDNPAYKPQITCNCKVGG